MKNILILGATGRIGKSIVRCVAFILCYTVLYNFPLSKSISTSGMT
ncbi:hypothetical protein EUBHAL_02826 [Anaerobutyricum hallii DSM 3353]|uniref:Uncharacterized protein n=1 Tax=Anaerobutyricum hallii DSM 3353 TaxID=411469 RepID=C0EZG5_9FIRM|nr:hypothetical protein EUBHAL_02826 [Anaerobutyricum hallii DSM 3353]